MDASVQALRSLMTFEPKDNHTSKGKWSEVSVPHKGWFCTGVDDLGEPSQICEMCNSAEVRYVHYMQHNAWPEVLAVGCVCAEHMSEDYVRPKQIEKGLRTLTSRRKTWDRKNWKTSQRGNLYLSIEGFVLAIIKQDHGFCIIVAKKNTSKPTFGRRLYPNIEAAKHAALPALIWAKEHL